MSLVTSVMGLILYPLYYNDYTSIYIYWSLDIRVSTYIQFCSDRCSVAMDDYIEDARELHKETMDM